MLMKNIIKSSNLRVWRERKRQYLEYFRLVCFRHGWNINTNVVKQCQSWNI